MMMNEISIDGVNIFHMEIDSDEKESYLINTKINENLINDNKIY